MGMIGNYVAVDDKLWQQVKNKEINIYEIGSDEFPQLNIDKAWQGIFFVLCNDMYDGEPPFSYVVPFSGEIIETDMIGAFYLNSDQVKEAYTSIMNMSEEDFKAKFNFDALLAEDEMYPSFSKEEGADLVFEYLYVNFKDIQEYYKQVVSKKMGVIFYIL